MPFMVVDISQRGIGLVIGVPVTRGSWVSMTLKSEFGEIQCTGQVRYCKPDTEQFGSYRVGVALDALDRLAGARWRRLYDAAA